MVLITVRLRMDTVDNTNTKPVHRLEVFTGAGRRRTWSAEDKALIVAESLGKRRFCLSRGPTARTFTTAIVWLATGVAR